MSNECEKGLGTSEVQEQTSNYELQKIHYEVDSEVNSNTENVKEALEESEILKNDELRKFLKEYSLTVNIDNPNDKNVIPVNDTKEYMKKME